MANATYLELTNDVLRHFQEVEIPIADWTSVKGLQAFAKLSVNNALREIYSKHHFWPFSHAAGSQVLTAGIQTYAWPADYKIADWKSFQIRKDDTLNVTAQRLVPIDREDWFDNYRDADSQTPSRNKPAMVFDAHGSSWGVTPSPDKAYTVDFDYYKKFTPLDAYTDETDVPRDFDHVIHHGAAVHMNLLLDNNEQATLVRNELFLPALKEMRTLLINNDLKMRDTRIRF